MIRVTDKQYFMDGYLKSNLDSLAYNIPNDWDSLILISGDGMVRVGKSVLAQQIGYYLSFKLKTKFDLNNIVFSGDELINKAKAYPMNSVFIYDEARGELDTKKVLEKITKVLMDFFAECGMYNHAIIIVLPDYFDLPKGLAINRSECLINVYRKAQVVKFKSGDEVTAFKRGYFEFYGRNAKKRLYIIGKKDFNNYAAGRKDFYGEFPNVFIVDKERYVEKKQKHLDRNRDKVKEDNRLAIALTVISKHMSLRQASEELKKEGFFISFMGIQQKISEIAKEKAFSKV